MRKNAWLLCAVCLSGVPFEVGCDQASANANVEKLPPVTPDLPEVPTLPPPPHPIQYADQSYSVFGLRRAMRRTLNTDVAVTAYIAEVFEPPACPRRKKCEAPPAPHLFLADTPDETDRRKMLLLAGYAENQDELAQAQRRFRAGRRPDTSPGGVPVVPGDFFKGAKIKAFGKFAYISGSGFQSSEGVLDYTGYEMLEPAPDSERK